MNSVELKEVRQELGLSQQEIADSLGHTSKRTYEKWENGQNPVPRSVSACVFLMLRYKGAVAALRGRYT